ncbi:MAG: hypothetical protein WA057_00605 [Candidatus Magasanikiibacteriota bacterium]
MKINKFFLVSLFLLIFFITPSIVFADGAAIMYEYNKNWDFSDETSQEAIIAYNNGLEKMVISMGSVDTDKDSVWLFPVPANPSGVVLDILDDFPSLDGKDIFLSASDNLEEIKDSAYGTQIYPLIYKFVIEQMSLASSYVDSGVSLGLDKSAGFALNGGVTVHERLEKDGMVSELITAKESKAIFDYLQKKGLKIDAGMIPALDNYIGQDYSFVVSWFSGNKNKITSEYVKNNLELYFSDQTKFSSFFALIMDLKQKYADFGDAHSTSDFLKDPGNINVLEELTSKIKEDPSIINFVEEKTTTEQKKRGLSIVFPAQRMYFPLTLTSVYGSKVVPATIRVLGYVTPQVFDSIQNFTQVKYFYNNGLLESSFYDAFKNFYNSNKDDLKYTRIDINSPSKLFSQDLWIDQTIPIKTYWTFFLAKHNFVSGILIFLLTSFITGVFAGMIVFKNLRRKIVKLGCLGLTNCLSIFSLIIFTLFINTKPTKSDGEILLTEIKQKKYFLRKKISNTVFLFNVPFLLFSFCLLYLIVPESINNGFAEDLYIPTLLASIPFVILGFTLYFGKINKEDRLLFTQLKTLGYSTWTLLPKDKAKVIFILLYSLLFLINTWWIIRLIKFIL